MILQVIRLKTTLSEDQLIQKARERQPQFQAIPGLIQKYYVKTAEEGIYAGVYVWDSVESIQEFQQTDLAKSIPQAYEVSETPNIELMNVLFQLRD